MNKNMSKFIKNAKTTLSKHSPEILTGLGIAGMITTTVLAVKATPKAMQLIEAKKELEGTDELKPIEVIKVAWKPYIPAAISCVTSTACLIGANSVHARRNAALATAYKISETALADYREKVIETIGEKKEQVIHDKVAKEKINKNPVNKNTVYDTGYGSTLCYDVISGRYFKSDIDKIKKAENELNHRMLSYEYISLNEFYDEIGLQRTSIGDDLGWNIGRDGMISLHFSSQLNENDVPCLVIDYQVAPRYDYSKLK